MKIKQPQSKPKPNPKNTSPTPASNPHITPIQQISLPTQNQIYNQLILQLGIKNKEERSHFRHNLRQKYYKHLKLLQENNQHVQRFNLSREKQLRQKQKKIDQIKQYIDKRQSQAIEKRNINSNQLKNRIKKQHQKWQEVINKNKYQYLNNIKKSMKLVKRWQKKIAYSIDKKNQMLNKVTEQVHQHNQHIVNVLERTRINQSIQAEINIQKLQESLAMKAQSRNNSNKKLRQRQRQSRVRSLIKINSKGDLNNPQAIRYQTPSNKILKSNSSSIIQRFKTQQSRLKNSQNLNSIPLKLNQLNNQQQQQSTSNRNDQYSPNIKINRSSKKLLHNYDNSRLSSNSNHLLLKNQLDQEQLSYSLLKNIEKQQKIIQARHLKSYLNNQKTKHNKQKQQQFINKVKQNTQKLQKQQRIRNIKLDQKYYGKKYTQQSQSTDKYNNVSLPLIINKRNKNNWLHQDIIKRKIKKDKNQDRFKQISEIRGYNLAFLTQLKNNNQSMNLDAYKNKNNSNINQQRKASNNSGIIPMGRALYEEHDQIKQDNSTKYNRKIMDKLRNLSLIVNFKNKNKKISSDRIQKQRIGKKQHYKSNRINY